MQTQTELSRMLDQARECTDALFELVRPEAIYDRPIAERHRMVFYLGHLEAFDWNLIGGYALGKRPFHAEFDRLFAFGIDPPSGQLPSDQASDWPSLAEIERYNQRTRDEIDDLLNEAPEQLLHVAIEHRLMHAETFAYILHGVAYDKKLGAPDPPVEAPNPKPRMIEIPAGSARLGLRPGEGFGWDNEFHAHTVDVPAFAIGKYKVTNRDYLEYVRAGADAPFFWTDHDGRWFYRGMFQEIPLPLDCPVYVTYREAEQYARWRGFTLPTEAQFQRAAEFASRETVGGPSGGSVHNYGFRRWDPEPVNANDNGFAGPAQLFGNGWEWTSTAFAPFPGFQPFPFYSNYSEPFFDGEHYVLKGASPRTAECLVRPSFRNWFRPSYPYIYATFRLLE